MVAIRVRVQNVVGPIRAVDLSHMMDEALARFLRAPIDDNDAVTSQSIAISQRDGIAAPSTVPHRQDVDLYAHWTRPQKLVRCDPDTLVAHRRQRQAHLPCVYSKHCW
jgi:hypothetical protein